MMWQAIEESEVPSLLTMGLGRAPVLHAGRWYARSGDRTVRWGFGDAAGDMAAFNLMVSNGDNSLAAGNANPSLATFSDAIQAYKSAGQAGAVTIGPEIDTQTGGASQPLTQQAWQLNGQLQALPNEGTGDPNILATMGARTAAGGDIADSAQSLAHQMQSLYNQAIQATPTTQAPSSARNLDAAAGALLQRLQTGGCTTSAFQECFDFQDAWNNAGGTPAFGSPGVPRDGKYGSQTEASLQSALNIGPNQPPQQAPASCFTASSTTPTHVPVQVPTTVITPSTPTNWTPWLIAGGVAVLGAGGYALYRYKKKHGHMPGMRRRAA